MNRIISRILLGLVAMTTATSCDVHEFPEPEASPVGPQDIEVILHLDFSLELPPYKDIIYTPSDGRADDPAKIYDLRYIVNYYRSTDGGRSYPTVPSGSITVGRSGIDQFNNDIVLHMAAGNYKFLVFTDYSAKGSLDDRLYRTTNFEAITLIFPHSGCDDYRDCFRGQQFAVISEDASNEVFVDMERPLGKFRFIATDFDRFMSRAEEAARAEWEETRAQNPEGDNSSGPPEVNLKDYRVIFRYPGFMPHVFNMHTNRPADATTGISFEGRLQRLSETEAELGYDYVFINGHEAPYTVAVDIYDKKGNLVGTSGAVDVPMIRSMLTTVRGEFLTTKAQGGVGVNPDFDGEFNIVIP